MSSRPRAPRRDQQRNREALLAAARDVFASRGLEAPLDLIARRAGVGNATLYRHFPERRDLVVAILLHNLERLSRVLQEAQNEASAWDGLGTFLAWQFDEQIDNAGFLEAMRAIPAGAHEQVDHLRDRSLAALERLIARAKAEGAMRPDRWVEDVFLALALNETLAVTRHTDPRSASRRFLQLVLDSLAAEPTPPAAGARPPRTVLALRRTLGRELAGLPDPAE